MIRDHFPGQQFIVVSLKKELFQNANVLFNVTFFNNRSNVERKELVMRKNSRSANSN